jgi:hypothetical protein
VSPEAFALKSWVICDKYRALCQSPRHQRRLRVAVVTKFIMAPKISNENSLGKGFAVNFRKKIEIIE